MSELSRVDIFRPIPDGTWRLVSEGVVCEDKDGRFYYANEIDKTLTAKDKELASWRKALEKGIEQTEMQCERNPACGDYEDCIPCAIALPMKKALKPTEE